MLTGMGDGSYPRSSFTPERDFTRSSIRYDNTLTLLVHQFRGDPESSESPQFRDLIARTEARIVAFGNLHRSLMVGAANTCISVQGTQVVGLLAVQRAPHDAARTRLGRP